MMAVGADSDRPTAEWVPTHRHLEDAIVADGTASMYVGNFWADIFAKMGSADIAVSNVLVRASEIKLRDARDAKRYVAWAAERVLRLSVGDSAKVPPVPAAPKVRVQKLMAMVTEHDVVMLPNGIIKCMTCYRYAATTLSYQKGLFHSKCCPPLVGEGHVVERVGFACFCAVCGAWSSESNRLSKKFQNRCLGPVANAKSRWKELDIMQQLWRGVNPLTKVPLERGRPLPASGSGC